MDVTVIIPTYNRRDALLQTLDALLRADYPPGRWEVVVIDDGSTESVDGSVSEVAAGTPVSVRFLRQRNAGPAAARNRGAGAALGRVLIFIDNDIVVGPRFLRDHLEALAASPGCWVVGRIGNPEHLRATPFGRYRDDLNESYQRVDSGVGPVPISGMTGQNVSMLADEFRQLGGFDERFTIASGEDWELAHRARESGIRILFHPGIIVLHNDWACTFDAYCRRQMMYSISDVLLWEKYGEDCPRAELVRENAPAAWGRDPARLVAKKAMKRALATPLGTRLVSAAARLVEGWAPDSRWSRRAYDLGVAVAIFRGVREGLGRHGTREDGPTPRSEAMR